MRPDAIALQTQQGPLTWKQVWQRVRVVQSQLQQEGLSGGDVILTVTQHSSPDTLFLYLACIEAGIVCAWSPLLPETQLRSRQRKLGTKAAYLCSTLIGETADLDDLLSLAAHSECSASQHSSLPASYRPDNLTSLVFTSGSTGEPKAVAHRVSNHLASAGGLQQAMGFEPDSCWLLSLPLYHVSGLGIVWRWLYAGCRLKLKQSPELELDGVSHTSMVPTQLLRVLQQDKQGSLQKVLLGGAIIPHQLARQAQDKGIEAWAGYGLTEMASTVTAKRVDEFDSAGSVLAGREVRLADNQRVWVKGETLAQGYWQHGELIPLVTNDGWFDSKDLGCWQNGELVVTGRADNQFISGGENIHCEEIERVLLQDPAVSQAFVIPLADEEYGHRPVAFIPGPLSSDKESRLHQLCLIHLQRFKCPVCYYPIPSELMSDGIKVSRKRLAEWLEARTQGRTER